jgi:succinate dehydrogenase/fumarate reductase flavoprotein subunit
MSDDNSFDDDDADYSMDGLMQDVRTVNCIREKMNLVMMNPVYSIASKLEEIKKWEKRLKDAEVREKKTDVNVKKATMTRL